MLIVLWYEDMLLEYGPCFLRLVYTEVYAVTHLFEEWENALARPSVKQKNKNSVLFWLVRIYLVFQNVFCS